MLAKIKNGPLWYKVWVISVAICAVYFLVKFCFFEIAPFDRLLEAFALVSFLVDYQFFSKPPGNTD